MAASQDKVQAILEGLLEDSLPLVHKGIFSTEELRLAMCEREKHENHMLRPTYKLSDYLKAIEFEYALERERKHRIETQSSANPLFKKQSKTDFVIVKRIIRLWDRTTHKFKCDVGIWKQYLAFCVASRSNKQFYKALSSALRFLPLEAELWKIGIQYEIEVGLNLWKARKLYIKALKMNPNKIQLWVAMLAFECYFLTQLALRQRAIEGEEKPIEFIMPEEQPGLQNDSSGEQDEGQPGTFDIDSHHEILVMVIQEAISKVPGQRDYILEQAESILNQEIAACRDRQVSKVLAKAKELLPKGEKQQKSPVKALVAPQNRSGSLGKEISAAGALTFEQTEKNICPFIIKQNELQKVLLALFEHHWAITIEVLLKSKKLKCLQLPPAALEKLISNLQSGRLKDELMRYTQSQISKVQPKDYREYPSLLAAVVQFNKAANPKANNTLYRSLTIHCRDHPEVLERCLHLIKTE